LTVFCGIDWAERHHDVALVDEAGTLLAKARITDDAAGYHQLLDLLAEHGDSPYDPIPVAIETSHGLLVASLRSGSRRVFAINPLAAARYRDRHGVSRKKSDPGDALVLANILRTDMHATGPCQPTPNSPRPSRSWPEPSRTLSGRGSRSPTRSARFCASAPQALADAITEGFTLMRTDTAGLRTDAVQRLLGRGPRTFADWCARNADAFRGPVKPREPTDDHALSRFC
jgi:hypothetical protein